MTRIKSLYAQYRGSTSFDSVDVRDTNTWDQLYKGYLNMVGKH